MYDEDADDGVFNTGEDTGWYRRFFFYTGSINSLTFRETDLTNSNTVFLDDIIIQNAIDIDPSTMITTETEQPTERSTDLLTVTTSIMITSEIDQSTEQPTVTAKITDNSPSMKPSFDLGLLKNSIALGFLFGVTVLIIVVSLKTPMPKS